METEFSTFYLQAIYWLTGINLSSFNWGRSKYKEILYPDMSRFVNTLSNV